MMNREITGSVRVITAQNQLRGQLSVFSRKIEKATYEKLERKRRDNDCQKCRPITGHPPWMVVLASYSQRTVSARYSPSILGNATVAREKREKRAEDRVRTSVKTSCP